MVVADIYNICKENPDRFGCVNGKHDCSDPRCYPNCPVCPVLPETNVYVATWFVVMGLTIVIILILFIILDIYNHYKLNKLKVILEKE